jgi:hypothetical protein
MIDMICFTEPGLTEALYMLLIHTFNNSKIYFVRTDNRLITADCDSGRGQTVLLVRENDAHQQTCNYLTLIQIWS